MFQQATRTGTKARVGIQGPAGSGKTKSALILATTLVGPDGKIFVIDTENNSASKYADQFKFATFNMTPDFGYAPKNYIAAIEAAENAGADVIIVDSMSHEWMGTGGALEMVDQASAKSKSHNSYVAWRDVTPEHRKLLEKVISCKTHIICTFRATVEYEKNDKGGYDKIGMKAITREGVDFEFDVWAEMSVDHKFWVSKTRCDALEDKVVSRPDAKFFMILKNWLDGASSADLAPKVVYEEKKKAEVPVVKTVAMLVAEAAQYGLNNQTELFGFLKKQGFTQFDPASYDQYIAALQSTIVEAPVP